VEVLIVIAALYFFTGVIESHAPVFWKIISTRYCIPLSLIHMSFRYVAQILKNAI